MIKNNHPVIYILTENSYLNQGFQQLLSPYPVKYLSSDFWYSETRPSFTRDDLLLVDSGTLSSLLIFHFDFGVLPKIVILSKKDRSDLMDCFVNQYILCCNCSPYELRSAIIDMSQSKYMTQSPLLNLSTREMSVFQDCLAGLSIDEIANKYNIKSKTVYAHRKNACFKIGIRKVHEFIPSLLQLGI